MIKLSSGQLFTGVLRSYFGGFQWKKGTQELPDFVARLLADVFEFRIVSAVKFVAF